ncbi:MAG: hypothetical protein PHR35_22195 [Kiritimatiellae bacterium]|nr:hypothetical protein [Kiritimatiellia bacterium]
MKSLAGVFLVVIAAWLGYVLLNSDPCERVRRGAAPVRLVFDGLRAAAAPWLKDSPSDRIRLLVWSVESDAATQKFLLFQFYDSSTACGSN